MWYFRSKNSFTLSGKQPSNPDNIVKVFPPSPGLDFRKLDKLVWFRFQAALATSPKEPTGRTGQEMKFFYLFCMQKKIEISFTVLHQSCKWNLRFHWLFSTNNDLWLYPLQDWWKTVNEISNFMYTGEIGNIIFRLVSGRNRYQKFWEGRSYSYTS